MPTYEYRCPQDHDFELFQRMSDEPVARCPECGKKAQRLLSSGAGLLFKGSGFYITDYRPDSYREAARKDGTETPGSGDGSGSGAEGKKGDGAARKGDGAANKGDTAAKKEPPRGTKSDAKGSPGSSSPKPASSGG